jgi:hypothetical protein
MSGIAGQGGTDERRTYLLRSGSRQGGQVIVVPHELHAELDEVFVVELSNPSLLVLNALQIKYPKTIPTTSIRVLYFACELTIRNSSKLVN